MPSKVVLRERRQVRADAFVETVVWFVDPPVRGSSHSFKYSLALVCRELCVLRFDNEAGRGDHKHVGGCEQPLLFSSIDDLIEAFYLEVERWLNEN
jgi:hypothetical protein